MNIRSIHLTYKALAAVIVVAVATVLASAQSETAKGVGSSKDPLFFVTLAANVAAGVHPVDGYIAIYIDQTTWNAALKDGDLGPFVKFKDAKAGRSMACLFSQSKNVVTCVYFDADKPFGVVSLLAHVNGKIDSSDIAAAYKKFSKDMVKENKDAPISFSPNEISSDDGTKLVAYIVSNPTKIKNLIQ